MVEPTRFASKRTKTRLALVTAARELVKERGHEKISIQDITDRADVGLGTFYNYFETKQMVFEAVLDEMRERFNERLSNLRDALTDPATMLAATLQFCFIEALDNEEWHEFVASSGLQGSYLLLQDHEQCLADIQLGTKRGRFKVDNPEFVAGLIQGMARHVTQEIIAGRLPREAIKDTSKYILRMLGLPELAAKALTQTPLPPVAAARRQPVKEILPHLERANA